MPEQVEGPARVVLTASVARRYYLDGRSKVEIAEEFGLEPVQGRPAPRRRPGQRPGPDRDPAPGRDRRGPVRPAAGAGSGCSTRSSWTRRTTTPSRCASIWDGRRPSCSPRSSPPRTCSGWRGRARSARWPRPDPGCPRYPVVQLTGALSVPEESDSSVDVVRDVARASGGPAYFFYAPFTVPDAATARALRQQPEVARAFAQLPVGHQGRRRGRAVGAGPVDPVRRRRRARPPRAAPPRRVC